MKQGTMILQVQPFQLHDIDLQEDGSFKLSLSYSVSKTNKKRGRKQATRDKAPWKMYSQLEDVLSMLRWKISSTIKHKGNWSSISSWRKNTTQPCSNIIARPPKSCPTIQIDRFEGLEWMRKMLHFKDVSGVQMEVWSFHHLIKARKFSSA